MLNKKTSKERFKGIQEVFSNEGCVCELIECNECGFTVLVPQPMKQFFDCRCGYLLDSCGTVRLKAIPLLPTINIDKAHSKKRHKK